MGAGRGQTRKTSFSTIRRWFSLIHLCYSLKRRPVKFSMPRLSLSGSLPRHGEMQNLNLCLPRNTRGRGAEEVQRALAALGKTDGQRLHLHAGDPFWFILRERAAASAPARSGSDVAPRVCSLLNFPHGSLASCGILKQPVNGWTGCLSVGLCMCGGLEINSRGRRVCFVSVSGLGWIK